MATRKASRSDDTRRHRRNEAKRNVIRRSVSEPDEVFLARADESSAKANAFYVSTSSVTFGDSSTSFRRQIARFPRVPCFPSKGKPFFIKGALIHYLRR